jgi:hypothetical protein
MAFDGLDRAEASDEQGNAGKNESNGLHLAIRLGGGGLDNRELLLR